MTTRLPTLAEITAAIAKIFADPEVRTALQTRQAAQARADAVAREHAAFAKTVETISAQVALLQTAVATLVAADQQRRELDGLTRAEHANGHLKQAQLEGSP